jgi:hypothetical protein
VEPFPATSLATHWASTMSEAGVVDDPIARTFPLWIRSESADSVSSISGPMQCPSWDLEGSTLWVNDDEVLQAVGAAYSTKYDWPVTITDKSTFDAPYGAPTAGSPPYSV